MCCVFCFVQFIHMCLVGEGVCCCCCCLLLQCNYLKFISYRVQIHVESSGQQNICYSGNNRGQFILLFISALMTLQLVSCLSCGHWNCFTKFYRRQAIVCRWLAVSIAMRTFILIPVPLLKQKKEMQQIAVITVEPAVQRFPCESA